MHATSIGASKKAGCVWVLYYPARVYVRIIIEWVSQRQHFLLASMLYINTIGN